MMAETHGVVFTALDITGWLMEFAMVLTFLGTFAVLTLWMLQLT